MMPFSTEPGLTLPGQRMIAGTRKPPSKTVPFVALNGVRTTEPGTFWAPEGGKGLQYVLQRHFVQGEPIHWWFLAGGFFIYGLAVLITQLRWYFLVRAQDLPFTVAGALLSMRIPRWVEVTTGEVPATLSYRHDSDPLRRGWHHEVKKVGGKLRQLFDRISERCG